MMGRRRPTIPPRRRFFLGCEGQSEHSYGTLLRLVSDEVGRVRIYLEIHDLRGGDPLAIVQAAIARRARQIYNRGSFEASAVLLDADKLGQNSARDAQLQPLAQQNQVLLVWQRPCHEALLLHHLPGCQNLMPQNSPDANFQLRRHWPEYEKPMSANRLRVRLGLAELASAATVEQELAALLSLLGFF
jgi:hypothetical protein